RNDRGGGGRRTCLLRRGCPAGSEERHKDEKCRSVHRSQIYDGRRDPCVKYRRLSAGLAMLLIQGAIAARQPFYFDGWYNIERTVTLSVIGFTALIVMLRVSGKRTLSKLNAFDFIFVVACGSVFAATIIEKDVTLLEGMFALATLIGIQVLLAEIAARWDTADRIINGHPTLIS